MNIQLHNNEFIALQEEPFGSTLMFPPYFSEKIMVSKEAPKKDTKMPLLVQIYIGGLSVIGLYFVYRLLRRR